MTFYQSWKSGVQDYIASIILHITMIGCYIWIFEWVRNYQVFDWFLGALIAIVIGLHFMLQYVVLFDRKNRMVFCIEEGYFERRIHNQLLDSIAWKNIEKIEKVQVGRDKYVEIICTGDQRFRFEYGRRRVIRIANHISDQRIREMFKAI